MTSMDYMPGAGTVPARVVAYLHSLPAGTEVGTGIIAEAIDADIAAIFAGTNAACIANLIERQKIGSRYLWSRGSRHVDAEFIKAHPPKRHVEIPAPIPMAERLATPRTIPVDDTPPPTLAMAASLRTEREIPPPESSPPEPAPQPVERPRQRITAPPEREIRFGLWSDGSLCVERNGRIETFNSEEAQKLARFLNFMLLRGRGEA